MIGPIDSIVLYAAIQGNVRTLSARGAITAFARNVIMTSACNKKNIMMPSSGSKGIVNLPNALKNSNAPVQAAGMTVLCASEYGNLDSALTMTSYPKP